MTDHERLGPPPIEPMSGAAWLRVERGVWSRLDADAAATAALAGRQPAPRARRWWLVAVPALAAAAVALVVVASGRGDDGRMASEPARVVSGAAPSSISFGDAHLELAPDTAVVMSHELASPTVLLEHGAAWFTVAPREARPPFVVRAGDATVRVIGTRFMVARADERITVDVERGLVDVQFRGAAVEVAAGQHWASGAPAITALRAQPGPPSPVTTASPAIDPGPSAAHPAALSPSPPTALPPAHPVALSPSPPAALPPAPPAALPPSPPAALPPAPPTALPPAPLAALAPSRAGSAAPPHGMATTPAPGASPATALDRDRAEYDRLAGLESRAPDAALAGYLALASGTSRWADPALFAAARLAVDRHDRRAHALLGVYLQRFPRGANAADARQLLVRIERDLP